MIQPNKWQSEKVIILRSTIMWNFQGVLYNMLLKQGETIMAECYEIQCLSD